MNNQLNRVLEERQSKVAQALAYLDKTQAIFERHASQELLASSETLKDIRQGFESDKVRIVVIGEFSRGKSRLINALLGIDLLPSAREATTAINTFLQSPPEHRKAEKYIKLNFIDDRETQELSWDNDGVLKRWGTELDKSNGDARRDLQKIEVFAAHELLDKGLVIIDTPGLESVVEHHEEITRQAIASSHIAIWVQSVEQLGGNNREWGFLRETIQQSFRKFLTVVNMWDQILDPEDAHDKEKPERQRVMEKLAIVKENFKSNLPDLSAECLQQMTDKKSLMGVSAKWALDADEEKQRRSGVGELIERIADLCDSGEASDEVFYAPLQKLALIQQQVLDGVDEQLQQLESVKDLEQQKHELELLDSKIKTEELELQQVTREHREEHTRVAGLLVKEINEELVQPLKSLQSEMELVLTEKYVKRAVESGKGKISLPAEAKHRYEQVMGSVDQTWKKQKKSIEEHLADLKAEYLEAMNEQGRQVAEGLDGIEINVPEIKVDFKFDLSSVERFQRQKMDMERALEQREEELDDYEQQRAELSTNDAQIRAANEAYERQNRQLEALGEQPNPRSYNERVEVKEAGTYSDAEYGSEVRYDHSNVEEYKKERQELQGRLGSREEVLNRLQEEEAKKAKQRVSLEALKRKAEKQFKKEEKKRQQLEEKASQEKQDVIADILTQLRGSTLGEIRNRVVFLEKNMEQAIEKVFADQLNALLQCVTEQFMQPLKAKMDDREKIHEIMTLGELEVEKSKAGLREAKQALEEVMGLTQTVLAEG